eukprot:TRINITY_DN8120_c0_g2_i1.p1 TRINITY_DN8120_c0_g2~~TRINITY_DN8120_c0_g2_i1.p1  ORF type:complete len:501 (-),score=44.40 TRINITY_DN8120_c0_g2_i1:296-1690(-)
MEKRLAGLLLLTRLLPKDDNKTIQKVFDQIGWGFIRTLLTPLHQHFVQEDQNDDSDRFNTCVGTCTVGTTLLSSFLSLDTSVTDLSEIQWFINPLKKIIKAGTIANALNIQINHDNRQQVYQQGFEQFSEQDKNILSEVMISAKTLASKNEDFRQEFLEEEVLTALIYILNQKQINLAQNCLYLCQQIISKDKNFAKQFIQRFPQFLNQIVIVISKSFDQIEKETKSDKQYIELSLDMLNTLLYVFPCPLPEGQQLQNLLLQSQSQWSQYLWQGLKFLFENKLGSIQKYSGYQLCASMIFIFGHQWLLQGKQDIKLPELIISSLCIELKLLFRDCFVSAKSSNKTRAYDVIPFCFVIVEATIDILCELEDSDSVGYELEMEIIKLFQAVEEVIFDVLAFLKEVKDGEQIENEDLLIGCVRVVGRYLAECPDGFSDQVDLLMNFMKSLQGGEGKKFLVPYLMQQK